MRGEGGLARDGTHRWLLGSARGQDLCIQLVRHGGTLLGLVVIEGDRLRRLQTEHALRPPRHHVRAQALPVARHLLSEIAEELSEMR